MRYGEVMVVVHLYYACNSGLKVRVRVSYRIFRKGGGNHLTPPTYQETVPITNVLTARIHLWKNYRCL